MPLHLRFDLGCSQNTRILCAVFCTHHSLTVPGPFINQIRGKGEVTWEEGVQSVIFYVSTMVFPSAHPSLNDLFCASKPRTHLSSPFRRSSFYKFIYIFFGIIFNDQKMLSLSHLEPKKSSLGGLEILWKKVDLRVNKKMATMITKRLRIRFHLIIIIINPDHGSKTGPHSWLQAPCFPFF